MSTNKNKLSVLGGIALAGAAVFAAAMNAQAASTVVASRTPYQWPDYLGTLTQGTTTIANVRGTADLTSARLFVDYLAGGGQTYDVDAFTLTCLYNSPNVPITAQNATGNGYYPQECPGWLLGNGLIQAGFSLKTP